MTEAVEVAKLPPPAAAARLRTAAGGSSRFWAGEFDADLRARGELLSAACALACERYRRAAGSWPADRNALVPAYLPAVPVDPVDGKPLRLARTADGLIVYSVGPDGVDNSGDVRTAARAALSADAGFRLWDAARRRQPPPTPAAPEAADE